jgi:hypothetical protein
VAPNFSRSFSGQHVIAKKRKKKIEETDEEQGKSLLITGLEKKKKKQTRYATLHVLPLPFRAIEQVPLLLR